MSYDGHANFAVSSVAVAPSPATSGTSLTVQSGDGALFPEVPFNAVIWPSASEALPTVSEIARVTDVTGDVLTLERATSTEPVVFGPISVAVGYQIMAGATAKNFDDLENQTLVAANNLGDVEDSNISRLFLAIPALTPAVVASAVNEALTGLPTIDLYSSLADGDFVLLTGQTDPSENGLWIAASGAWLRPEEFPSDAGMQSRTCGVMFGTANGPAAWILQQPQSLGDITIDTDPQTWVRLT